MTKKFKLTLIMLGLLVLPGLSKADSPSIIQDQPQSSPSVVVGDVLKTLPNLKQGVAYDIQAKEFDYFTSAELVNYKGFSLSGGFTAGNKLVAAFDYDIGGLEKLGMNVPILNLVDLRLGFMVGIGNISTSNGEDRNKVAYGPEVTIVSVKF